MGERIKAGLAEAVDFWFGELNEEGQADEQHTASWWKKDEAFDDEVRKKFGWLHACLSAAFGTEELRRTLCARTHLLGAVIVLDQFSRNMFRDTPAMYATDPQAMSYCYELIGRGVLDLPSCYRSFVYMPLMHSERIEDQERCVALFEEFSSTASSANKKGAEAQLGYAVAHRDIVARWGRFPHRNQILGRESTAEEVEFLKQPGSGF